MGRLKRHWLGKEEQPPAEAPFDWSTGSARRRGRGWGQAEAQGAFPPPPHTSVRGDWDLVTQGLYPRDTFSLYCTVPRLTLPLARGYLLVTPPRLGPSQPEKASGHLRPTLNTEPQSGAFLGEN